MFFISVPKTGEVLDEDLDPILRAYPGLKTAVGIFGCGYLRCNSLWRSGPVMFVEGVRAFGHKGRDGVNGGLRLREYFHEVVGDDVVG